MLGDYDNLVKMLEDLQLEAAALEAHEGKKADLGSDAYAAYLAAVEAHNENVDEFNVAAAAYNAAVETYNAAVDTYNDDKPEVPAGSTTEEAQSTGTADWGNFTDTNMYFNHLDVRYDAAASKDQIVDANGKVIGYSNVTNKYDVEGVYYDEAAKNDDSDAYGITYTNTQGQKVEYDMVKDDHHDEFCTSSTNPWTGEIDRTDASANKNTKVSFYATLKDASGQTKGITVNLDANSVYAQNSYVKYDPNDHLDDYRDSSGKELEKVWIDNELYYNVSGKSVYLVSALVCDGYGFRMGGLDLILNVQTMIEIHQSTSAKKLGYVNYELGKTAHTYDPGNPGEFDKDLPTLQTTARLEKLEHLDKLDEKVVIDFGDPLNPLTPVEDLDTIEGVNRIDTTITPVESLDKLDEVDPLAPIGTLDTLEALDEMELLDPPEPPAPQPNPGPNPNPQPVVFNDDGLVIIDDGPVPLADVPKTGDASVVFGAMSAFSGFGLAFMQLFGRKKKEEN